MYIFQNRTTYGPNLSQSSSPLDQQQGQLNPPISACPLLRLQHQVEHLEPVDLLARGGVPHLHLLPARLPPQPTLLQAQLEQDQLGGKEERTCASA